MTSLLVLCCLFLPVLSLEKRSPLDLGSLGTRDRWTPKSDKKSYNSYSDQNKNHSFEVFKGNPTEYTIGGVLSGAPGVEFYFTQVLSVSLLGARITPHSQFTPLKNFCQRRKFGGQYFCTFFTKILYLDFCTR